MLKRTLILFFEDTIIPDFPATHVATWEMEIDGKTWLLDVDLNEAEIMGDMVTINHDIEQTIVLYDGDRKERARMKWNDICNYFLRAKLKKEESDEKITIWIDEDTLTEDEISNF